MTPTPSIARPTVASITPIATTLAASIFRMIVTPGAEGPERVGLERPSYVANPVTLSFRIPREVSASNRDCPDCPTSRCRK